jgi:Mg2+ and Co2+ transporter CorA
MIIPPGWNLPDPIRARLGQKTFGRQRIILEDGHLLIILHKPPTAEDTTREGVLFWRTPDGNWKWTRGIGAAALAAHVQSYADHEAALSSAFDEAKDAESLYEIQAEVTPVARSARNMHTALQAARDAVKADKMLIDVRDRAYEIERNLELLLDDIRNMIQFRSIKEAEEQSRLSSEALRASHRLNVLAAIFLPLTAITGVFGMNFASGFDQTSAPFFWVIFFAAAGLGFALKEWVLAAPDKKIPAKKAVLKPAAPKSKL